MKPYGMTKLLSRDTDVLGCIQNGRATRVYSLTGRAFRGLRGGRKDAARRLHKRRARAEGKAAAEEGREL